jgi:RimJ/RimL family protein N-acetyltransferase
LGYRDVRIDTHPANEPMKRAIASTGFTYRGVVEFAIPDGVRAAFQLLLD